MPADRTMFSVVIPVYNERAILPELAQRVLAACDRLDFHGYEILLVSDGSTDGSNEIIAQLERENPVFQGLILTRNFGHQAAVSVGLEHARGSVVAVIDGDLQDPPEVFPDLIAALDRGAAVAYAVRRNRKENLAKRAAYHAFYRLLRAVSCIDIPLDSGDFCAMRRCLVDDMLRLPERKRFVRGLRAWVGHKQVGVEYERHARAAGESKFTLRKLLGLAYDGVFSFSSLPVKLMQFFGFAISGLAFITALVYLGWYLAAPARFPAGWATLVISIWFIGGVQLLFMGLLGEYVFRTFDETRQRPVALVQRSADALEATCNPTTHVPTRTSTTATGGGAPAGTPSWTRSAA